MTALSPREVARRIGEPHPPTGEQEAAVAAGSHPLVVVAGAGSGKTQTMALRVVWLVANGLVEPHRVLGLTFTRKAAAELGERVRGMLRRLRAAHADQPFLAAGVVAGLAAGEPAVATYNAYAAGLAAEHALRIGLEPSMRLIGEAMSWQYAATCVESYDGAVGTDRALNSVIGDVRALAGELAEHLREPAEVVDLTVAVRDHLTALPKAARQRVQSPPAEVRDVLTLLDHRLDLLPMVERYTRRKRERGAIDYGDQVALAARIATEHPEVADIERSRFGAVLLDEYQDTGEAQRVLLTALFAGHPVTAVGDPRQSIYGWRGASAGNLERFLADFAGADGPREQCSLSRSFRNAAAVLDVANTLAPGIPLRGLDDRPLVPRADRADRGAVVVALHRAVTDEAAWIADRVASLGARAHAPVPWGEIVVLARRRAQFPRLEEALRSRGVPCEVVGLGGLLLEPEVVEIVSTLRVLADPCAGHAVVRLLAGPRWRLGPRDLDALGRRARALALRHPWMGRPAAARDGAQLEAAVDSEYDVVDERSLVDALDDPGDAQRYSAEGYHRLCQLRDELRRLRERSAQRLPDLVSAVASSLCLDVELASRPGVRPADALRSIDRFIEVAEEFVSSGEDAGVLAFLGYLDTAEERERGLELDRADEADPDAERVQLMTVHAAKGLEWDAVFVTGLTSSVFPVEGQAVSNWTRQIATLPFPLRGDRGELPELAWATYTDQVQARDGLVSFKDDCKRRSLLEEQRLAYVAVTRARTLLTCSGYWWDSAAKQKRGPSTLLTAVQGACVRGGGEVAVWADEPGDDETNPVLGVPVQRPWPFDPLGARRPAVEAAAALVAAALVAAAPPEHHTGQHPLVMAWRAEADILLAELARTRDQHAPVVELPTHLSVSQLVELRRDPAGLARQIRRPLPRQPARTARRGTRFHLWLEQRWGQQRLLDVDELPGAADDAAAPDADLVVLQKAFQASEWWTRVPTDVEFPFDLVVDGLLLRGRCDAVFTDAPEGLVDVVDWKTGRPKTGADAEAAAVQLAVYRLAWHHLGGVPLERIRAAFHYVGANRTVRPADLMDHDDLVALVRRLPVGPPAGAATSSGVIGRS